MFDDMPSLLAVLMRFGHIVFGIIWIGQLYFLNLVNVPFQKDLDAAQKLAINPKLLLRVFWWFRWGAMWTFVFGWVLLGYKYGHQKLMFESPGVLSNRALWIFFGSALGSVMWFNVWFVIWPRQRQILGALAKGAPHPEAATLAATALKASRLNLFLSGPMLFGMIVPNNYSGWPAVGMLFAVVVGCGFWMGPLKRSLKVPTTVD